MSLSLYIWCSCRVVLYSVVAEKSQGLQFVIKRKLYIHLVFFVFLVVMTC
jgi:hypothetical protein